MMKLNSIKTALFVIAYLPLLMACGKNDYLDIDASERPALSAKVKFVNARPSASAVHFWDFTRQVTSAALVRNGSTAYLDTQYGKVQFNLTEGTGTTYKASYLFGGSANFVQESNTASFSGPNGPIATFYHTLFAVAKLKPSTLNPGNTDSLILVYDDLTAPSAGKAKLRFANFAVPARAVDLAYAAGTSIFTGVGYGSFGDQVIIPYTNGKSSDNIPGLTWKTLGPFKELNAGTNQNLEIRNTTGGAVVPVTGLTGINLEAGKLYTIFINNPVGDSNLSATVIVQSL
ncbi:DUF4397 domain-containing protein [Pedobacter hiemivivus]|uniref:DUF4397 domain-containing protein n=1 Tax=Pedobacter hiemivivus TaxID=2530454 RepID=A0A4R0N8V0_9SPHI|nr:DUF4397 domain-containing protein [Pedobacter hiemivivus]TCC95783.1 DUF4397 domain-containing protein [Pedobacter hiemivivus]